MRISLHLDRTDLTRSALDEAEDDLEIRLKQRAHPDEIARVEGLVKQYTEEMHALLQADIELTSKNLATAQRILDEAETATVDLTEAELATLQDELQAQQELLSEKTKAAEEFEDVHTQPEQAAVAGTTQQAAGSGDSNELDCGQGATECNSSAASQAWIGGVIGGVVLAIFLVSIVVCMYKSRQPAAPTNSTLSAFTRNTDALQTQAGGDEAMYYAPAAAGDKRRSSLLSTKSASGPAESNVHDEYDFPTTMPAPSQGPVQNQYADMGLGVGTGPDYDQAGFVAPTRQESDFSYEVPTNEAGLLQEVQVASV